MILFIYCISEQEKRYWLGKLCKFQDYQKYRTRFSCPALQLVCDRAYVRISLMWFWFTRTFNRDKHKHSPKINSCIKGNYLPPANILSNKSAQFTAGCANWDISRPGDFRRIRINWTITSGVSWGPTSLKILARLKLIKQSSTESLYIYISIQPESMPLQNNLSSAVRFWTRSKG